MLGKPKYNYKDRVKFKIKKTNGEDVELEGTIEIIDEYGTFMQDDDVSYDIMVEHSHFNNEPCLYKHIIETLITSLIIDDYE